MSHHHSASKNILWALVLNFLFAIIEIIGGFYTNSIAILSDALHDLGDCTSLFISFILEKKSQKAPDKDYTYGYKRYSLLAAIINGVILITGSLFVIKEAIERIFNPEPVIAEGMMVLAIIGVFVNSFAAYKLSKGEGLNQRMVMFHLLEDILGWVAVLIVSIVLIFWPFYILDSILSILISLIILRGVYVNLRKVIDIFLLKFPNDISLKNIIKEINQIKEVVDIHYVKGWSIDELNSSLTFHVTLPNNLTILKMDQIKLKIKGILDSYGIKDSFIEFEGENFSCEK